MAKECYIFDGLTSREKSVESAFSLASEMLHRSISSVPGGNAHSRSYCKPGDQKEELLNEFFVLTGRYPVNFWEYSRPEMWQRVQGEKWLLMEEEEGKQRVELGLPAVNLDLLAAVSGDVLSSNAAAAPAVSAAAPLALMPVQEAGSKGPRRLVWQKTDKETLALAFAKHGTNWRKAADDTCLPFAPILMLLSGKERANKLKVIISVRVRQTATLTDCNKLSFCRPIFTAPDLQIFAKSTQDRRS